ncbi:anion exchange transporter [Rhinophrynus dorsalis]
MQRIKKKKWFSSSWERISTIGFTEVGTWCLKRIPILEWAPKYSVKDNLLPDTVSGMMLTVDQVTQGLAFAVMSSVHPVFGLYGSLFPPLIYAIFGMGRHVCTGTFAITSLISAGAVERLVSSNNDNVTNCSLGALGLSDFEMQRIGVAAAVTFLGGIIQISLFLFQLGSATFLLSEPVVSSMTTGAATHVVTSQVKYLLGMKVPYISGPLGMFNIYIYILKNITTVTVGSLLLSILSLAVLVLVKEMNEKFKNKIRFVIPIDIILIIATSLACYLANMEYEYNIDVVGHIPTGIPLPQAPPMDVLSEVVSEGFGVALVGYTVSIFLAYNSAKKFKYSVDENQELFAHGLSNVIPSFLFCIPNAGAPARSFQLYNNGAKSQVACLISCLMILLVIYFIGPVLYWLPMCVLASIIVVALKGMLIQFRDLKKYWNVCKIDWIIWVCTYVFTICFAANIGLLFGVVFSIGLGVLRLTRTRTLHLKQMDEESNKMIEDYSKSIQNVKIISVGTPLFFLNAKKVFADLMKMNSNLLTGCNLQKHKANVSMSNGDCNGDASLTQPLRDETSTLILDCRGITFFDYTGVTILIQIFMELKGNSTDVLLACCNGPLVKALKYSGIGSKQQVFFDSVKSALTAIQFKSDNGSNLEAIDSSDV